MMTKKKNGIVKLKIVVEKLQKGLLLGKKLSATYYMDSNNVPDDVKEGHFAVVAVDEDELKRFIVPLRYLRNPLFLRLLEQAEEEYGFYHGGGALTVPCRPSELERLLSEQRDSRVCVKWGGGSSCKTVVKSC